jgi:hypothetical protein
VWVVLLLCALYVVLSVFTAIISIRYYGMMKAPGWEARATNAGWIVTSIVPDGAAAGRLEPGDRLLALNGDERAAVLGPPLLDNVPVDHTYRVDLARDGRQFSAELMLPLVQGPLLWPIFQIIGLVFFVCGAALALLRPDDPQVRLVGGVLMAVGFTTLLEAEGSARRFPLGPAERSIQTLIAALSLFTFPMAFHFFNRFPSWKSPGPLWRATQWLLYALLACVFLPAWVVNFLGYDVTAETSRFVLAHPSLYLTCVQISARGVFVYIGGCLLLAIGVMVVETLTGARPFGGQTPQEILTALLQGEYHVSGESAEIRALDAILRGCLAKDARDRYGSAAELAKDLVPALAGCGGVGAHHGLTMSDSPTLGERNRL